MMTGGMGTVECFRLVVTPDILAINETVQAAKAKSLI
jgi:hypothetical protein